MSAQPGRVLNGRYRLIRTVGVGSQASVWVAEHLALSTQVAVKLIDPDLSKRPDARERFKREATAAAQLRSPHVVQILDHGIAPAPEGDQPFIVMELLEGEDLFQRLEKRHHLSLRDTSKILTQVARALTRAHAAGIVHRDLKPENIFLTHNDDDEIVKVLDFGVAKVRDAAKVTMQKTGVGTLIGTPHYMSPEQVKGIGEVDYRTDIWALGVLAFQCVTGDLPFDSEGVGDLLIKITIGDMPVPSKMMNGVPPAFDGWFARACDRDPARRFASARAAAEGLARIAGLGAGTGPTTVPRPGASIPPPADPTKRPSDAPPPPKAAPSASPPPKVEKPEEALDDDDWEEAEPVVSVSFAPPAPAEEIPAVQAPRPPKPPSGLAAPPAPLPSAASAPAATPSRPEAPAPVEEEPEAAGPVNPFTDSSAAPAATAPNPFLVNDFVPVRGAPPAPHSSAGGARPPAPPPSSSAAAPYVAPPPASGPRSSVSMGSQAAPNPGALGARTTVSGVESPDLDDDEELAFGKNRRKKLVRWFTIGLVVLAAGVTWMVVSSQLRARDPVPDAATAPPAESTPPVPPAFDPTPSTTSSDTTSSVTTTSTVSTKPTSKPRPTGGTGPVRPAPVKKKPNDGSVELPTPDDLPPPAP